MRQEPFDPHEFERLSHDVAWVARVVASAETGSTNDDAVRLARDGAPEGTVVVADLQTAGRGRLGRRWIAERGVALHASWLVRPAYPAEQWPLLTLAAAAAAGEAIEAKTGVGVRLKWPNDLLAGEGKLGGILAEAVPEAGAVVVGLGVNVRQDAFEGELAATATSLLLERAAPIGRARLLGAILSAFAPFAAAPRAALDAYRRRCDTIGREVRVERAGAEPVVGRAAAVADDGALVVDAAGDRLRLAAGDVVHLRAAV